MNTKENIILDVRGYLEFCKIRIMKDIAAITKPGQIIKVITEVSLKSKLKKAILNNINGIELIKTINHEKNYYNYFRRY